jgi:hypothetical protein
MSATLVDRLDKAEVDAGSTAVLRTACRVPELGHSL